MALETCQNREKEKLFLRKIGVPHAEFRVVKNLAAVLAAAGKTFDDVVKSNVYLSDMANFAQMNAVYALHFSAPYPARTTVAVRELPKSCLVEIDIIAQ